MAVDSWETDRGFVGAGSNDLIEATFDVAGAPVREITVAVTYAEFENGDRFGATPECTYAKMLVPRRSAILDGYRKILDKLSSGVSAEEVDTFVAQQPGLHWLKIARAQRGYSFMLEQIHRPRVIVR